LSIHAKQVAKFLNERLREEVDAVLVHCFAGASRSPSLAMAIADATGLSRWSIDWSPQDPTVEPPNVHVYETTLEALASCI
jgi:predicted protein tyrosine phosphatase